MDPIERNREFIPNGQESFPHQPSKGLSSAHQVISAVKFVSLHVQDQFLDIKFNEDDRPSQFLKSGQQLRNTDVLLFLDYLKKKFPKANSSIGVDVRHLLSTPRDIEDMDPLYVFTGKKEKPPEIDEEWMLVDGEDLVEQQLDHDQKDECKEAIKHEWKQDVIVYPFIYPGKRAIYFSHIVLIIIDKKAKKIYYYDPQGLTSNDSSRLGLFEDNKEFNMHENLVQLAKALFGQKSDQVEVIENIAVHQTDPVNCGVFICRVLKRLYKGMSIPEALTYDQSQESISDTRKRMGIALMRALQQ